VASGLGGRRSNSLLKPIPSTGSVLARPLFFVFNQPRYKGGEDLPVWIETVIGAENAKKRLMKLASIRPRKIGIGMDATYDVFKGPRASGAFSLLLALLSGS
jgi:hypothetical protein